MTDSNNLSNSTDNTIWYTTMDLVTGSTLRSGNCFCFSRECVAKGREDVITELFGDNASVFRDILVITDDTPSDNLPLTWYAFQVASFTEMHVSEFVQLLNTNIVEDFVQVFVREELPTRG